MKKILLYSCILSFVIVSSCREADSLFDPGTTFGPDPVINLIEPVDGYLAGVDSVIVTGENFSTVIDELTINFGGSPGTIKKATANQLIVRPGTRSGENLSVRVSNRDAELFSNSYSYDLAQPFGLYPGLTSSNSPTTPIAIDSQNNIYSIINSNGLIRYTKVSPNGTIEVDEVKYPGEPRPDPNDKRQYPSDSTMRFIAYSDMEVGPGGVLLMSQQNIRAIFQKTFGDDKRETVWVASSTGTLKIRDMVFDNNGFLWVVGLDSDQIHRFTAASPGGSETTFPFEGALSSVAFHSVTNELFVGGLISDRQEVWKFTIDGSGNIGAGELYFDFEGNYDGTVSSMVLASNGELLITTGSNADEEERPSIVRVFPDGSHQELYEGMLKLGAFSITWRDDNLAVVAVNSEETSINFLDMYDRTRSGIFGF